MPYIATLGSHSFSQDRASDLKQIYSESSCQGLSEYITYLEYVV